MGPELVHIPLFRRFSRIPPRLACVAAFAGLCALAGPAREEKHAPPAPEVQAVLDRLDRAQGTIQTLKADVVETRSLALLTQPQVLRAKVSFERPGKIRWEYSQPEKRVYVLADGRLTGWIPSRNQVERVNVSRYEQRLRRIIAFGQESRVLVKDFAIVLAPPGSASGLDELVLSPKSRRVKRKVQEIRLAVDRKSGMPQRIQYTTPDDDRVRIDFQNILVNHGLAPDTFALQVPPGARVVDGLTSLGFGVPDDDSAGPEEQ
jgi:outer membrane lipoprotein carrier protein